jgi:hypothetical protein
MGNRTTVSLTGPDAEGRFDAPGFVIDQKGIHSFVVDHEGALQDAGLDELGWHGQCLAFRRGDTWNLNPAFSQVPNLAHLLLVNMSFTSQDRVSEISVFLDGQCIGKEKEVRIECNYGPHDDTIIRAGWAVACFRDGGWHRQDYNGDLHEAGCLTIGPGDFHGPLAAPDLPEWHFMPQPRSRPSSLSSARLALPV